MGFDIESGSSGMKRFFIKTLFIGLAVLGAGYFLNKRYQDDQREKNTGINQIEHERKKPDSTYNLLPNDSIIFDSSNIVKPSVDSLSQYGHSSSIIDSSNIISSSPDTLTNFVPPSQDTTNIVNPHQNDSTNLENIIDDIQFPTSKLPNSLEGKYYNGIQSVEIEKNLWTTVANFYNLSDNVEIANMVNFVAEFNELNNSDVKVKKTIVLDELYVKNGNVKSGQDGIKGDVTFKDKFYLLPVFENNEPSVKINTNVQPNQQNQNIVNASNISNIPDISNILDENEGDNNNNQNPSNLPYTPLALALSLPFVRGKGPETDDPEIDFKAIAKTYNSNFTNGKTGIKKIMKKYNASEDIAKKLIKDSKEYHSLNYSNKLLTLTTKEDLADSVLLYMDSKNNKEAMQKIESMTGLKLQSTGSLYRLIDYAQNELGINYKIRKTQLNKKDSITKNNLYEQLNKYTNVNETINTYKIAS